MDLLTTMSQSSTLATSKLSYSCPWIFLIFLLSPRSRQRQRFSSNSIHSSAHSPSDIWQETSSLACHRLFNNSQWCVWRDDCLLGYTSGGFSINWLTDFNIMSNRWSYFMLRGYEIAFIFIFFVNFILKRFFWFLHIRFDVLNP